MLGRVSEEGTGVEEVDVVVVLLELAVVVGVEGGE